MKTTIAIVLVGFYVLACAPAATDITGSWKSDNAGNQKVNSILVTAMTPKTNARQTVEDDLSAALQQNGVRTLKSLDVMPPTFSNKEPDREELMEKINGTDVDAILTVALLDKETETRYVPGSYGYEPIPRYSYYGRFWGYYSAWYPTLFSPGYYEEDKIYFIETNLYDADTEELLWSAQSETLNPRGLEEFSSEFATAVINKLKEDGIITRREGAPLAKDQD